jgi:hypothetical protein
MKDLYGNLAHLRFQRRPPDARHGQTQKMRTSWADFRCTRHSGALNGRNLLTIQPLYVHPLVASRCSSLSVGTFPAVIEVSGRFINYV